MQGTVADSVVIDYVQLKADNLNSLQTTAEYGKVIKLYPTIIDLQAQPPGFWEKMQRGPAI